MNEKHITQLDQLKDRKEQVDKQFTHISYNLQKIHQINLSFQSHFHFQQFNSYTHSQNFQATRILISLQESLKNVHHYCNYAHTLNSKNLKKIANYRRDLQINQQELEDLSERIQEINKQYESVCHQLSQKQLEVNQLRALNKIDISYITSIDLKNSQLAEPYSYSKEKRPIELCSNSTYSKMNIPDEPMSPSKLFGPDNIMSSIYDLLLRIEDCQNQDFSDHADREKKKDKNITAVEQESSSKQSEEDYHQLQKLQYAVVQIN